MQGTPTKENQKETKKELNITKILQGTPTLEVKIEGVQKLNITKILQGTPTKEINTLLNEKAKHY